MFQDLGKRISRNVRQRKIAALVRRGIVPEGTYELGEIYEALRRTRKPGVVEMFGFLMVRVFRKRGYLYSCEDLGLVSAKCVTLAFTQYLVDQLQAANANFNTFKYHDMGSNGDATANTHTALLTSEEDRVAGTQVENGTSQYKSVGTITATSGYTVNEHGLFNLATSGVMLDRNLVPNAPVVIANDTVEFTYELTVNAEAATN